MGFKGLLIKNYCENITVRKTENKFLVFKNQSMSKLLKLDWCIKKSLSIKNFDQTGFLRRGDVFCLIPVNVLSN